jgi:hypothetical protein
MEEVTPRPSIITNIKILYEKSKNTSQTKNSNKRKRIQTLESSKV